jgi:cell wall assembly regulator SMI1
MSEASVEELWTGITNWLQVNAPDLLATLQPGANEQEIAQLEQQLGVRLPNEYRTFLTLCNGQHDEALWFYKGELLSISSVKYQWQAWSDLLESGIFNDTYSQPDSGIRNDWWNLKWIPFTHDGSGDHLCLDLAPATGGTLGQIITMWHDSEGRELLFSNFTQWLTHLSAGLESGEIVLNGNNALVDTSELER